MGHRHYSDYVAHCLRFYARYKNPTFTSKASEYDWQACKEALLTFKPKEREALVAVYLSKDTLPDSVYEVSKTMDIPQNRLWKLVDRIEKAVAEKRGLI